MQKMLTLFKRVKQGNKFLAIDEVEEGCEWVVRGEGIATQKIDGTCCAVIHGVFYKRHRVKQGKLKPTGWLHWSKDSEVVSGHGWSFVDDSNNDQYHREGYENSKNKYGILPNGTYELVGPKIQKNIYDLDRHELWIHGDIEEIGVPLFYDYLRNYLEHSYLEGIVWHHSDGRMVKIKRRDFGIQWP